MLVTFIQNKKETWEDYLDTCIYAYNTSVHDSSKFTPFELMFARKPVLPIDLQYDQQDIDVAHTDYQQGWYRTYTCRWIV